MGVCVHRAPKTQMAQRAPRTAPSASGPQPTPRRSCCGRIRPKASPRALRGPPAAASWPRRSRTALLVPTPTPEPSTGDDRRQTERRRSGFPLGYRGTREQAEGKRRGKMVLSDPFICPSSPSVRLSDCTSVCPRLEAVRNTGQERGPVRVEERRADPRGLRPRCRRRVGSRSPTVAAQGLGEICVAREVTKPKSPAGERNCDARMATNPTLRNANRISAHTPLHPPHRPRRVRTSPGPRIERSYPRTRLPAETRSGGTRGRTRRRRGPEAPGGAFRP